MGESNESGDDDGVNSSDEDESEEEDANQRPNLAANAPFRTLPDGSHALIIEPGVRLKIDLSDLAKGGDASKEERAKKARQKKRRKERLKAEGKLLSAKEKEKQMCSRDSFGCWKKLLHSHSHLHSRALQCSVG